jgi:hypothetical protein
MPFAGNTIIGNEIDMVEVMSLIVTSLMAPYEACTTVEFD